MAGSQFATPPRVAPSKPSRRFTVDQANKTLPLVKRIVADIVKTNAEAAALQDRIDATPGGKDHLTAEAELGRRVGRLNELVDELGEVGAELKDYRTGLIDFMGHHDGRDVYLCWKPGEDRINFWHELEAGFAGRKPVSQLREAK